MIEQYSREKELKYFPKIDLDNWRKVLMWVTACGIGLRDFKSPALAYSGQGISETTAWKY